MSRRADWPAGRSAAGCVDCVALSAVRRVAFARSPLISCWVGRLACAISGWGAAASTIFRCNPTRFVLGWLALRPCFAFVVSFVCKYAPCVSLFFVSWPLFWLLAMLLFSSREGSCPFLATMAAHKLQYA